MNDEKILEVIQIYRELFLSKKIEPIDYPHELMLDSPENGLAHCHGMLSKMEQFLKEGRREKTFRWLGFIQGVLWITFNCSLEQLMNHNHPDATKEVKQNPHYWGGWHYVANGFELYRQVLRVLKRQQGRPVTVDEILQDEGVLSCYTPRHFMLLCNPPNARRARQAIRGAIGYLRRKGHIIESTKEFGPTTYSWLGK